MKIKLHIGCGKRDFGEGWCHMDAADYPHVKFSSIDTIPFERETVDLIYASHVIEYYDREEVIILLKEWYQSIKNGGILRLAVPDFSAICKLYVNNYFSLDKFLGPLYGKMQVTSSDGNKMMFYHKTAYDFESLKDILLSVGFQGIHRYDWRKTEHAMFDDHSQAYLPHMDKESGTLISLNVEATK